MRRVRRTAPDVRLEITPLIDVIFLLLTFFLFSIVLMVRADVLDVRVPELSAGRSERAPATVTVVITADGSTIVDGEPTPIPGIVARVKTRLEALDEGAPVLLAVDQGAPAGRLIEVADALTGGGVDRFSVIGRPTEGNARSAPEPGP